MVPDDRDPGFDVRAAREHLLGERRGTVERVLDCADAVAAGWDGSATTDSDAVAGPLRATLERGGVLGKLPALLAGAVAAGGGRLRAEPVAAPPYVAVTGVGPVLRGTLEDGRLVVTVRAFDVERDPVRYVRGATTVADALDVAVAGR